MFSKLYARKNFLYLIFKFREERGEVMQATFSFGPIEDVLGLFHTSFWYHCPQKHV